MSSLEGTCGNIVKEEKNVDEINEESDRQLFNFVYLVCLQTFFNGYLVVVLFTT